MSDFIMEYVMPIFLVLFLTLALIVSGMLIAKLAKTETLTTRVIVDKSYTQNVENLNNIERFGTVMNSLEQ